MVTVDTPPFNNFSKTQHPITACLVCSGGLRKGGAPVQSKWGGPFLYTLLYHVLSALAIKRNNAFHK